MVAPARIAISTVRFRESCSVRVASIDDHCTLSQRLRAWVTAAWIRSAIAFWSRLCISRCVGEVPMKVWMRGRFAWRTASQQRSMSA